jgi:hypothetical protein
MITKADIEKRIEELHLEGTVQVAKTEASYLGAIGELERLLSSFESSKEDKKTEK